MVLMYGILRFTDPDPKASIGDQLCKEVHASDLDNWIKTHPDEIEDEHATGWNKMYNNFTATARVEAEQVRQLAQYARKEDNRMRSMKEKGRMSTLAGNKTINEQLQTLEARDSGGKDSLSDRMSARVEQFKKKFTRATKGNVVVGLA